MEEKKAKLPVVMNEDGFRVRSDGPLIQWPMKAQSWDEDMAKLCHKSISAQQYWLKKWETDPMAFNQYRKELQYHNRKEVDPYFKKGVIGSGMGAKVAKEEILKLYNEAREKKDVKATDEYLKKYVNKLSKKEGMEFLMGAFQNPTYTSEEREKVGELVTARSIAIDTRKAQKLIQS